MRQRLGDLLKPVPFDNHTPKAFSVLKKQPLKRRVKVNSAFSLPARPPWNPVLSNLWYAASFLSSTTRTYTDVPSFQHPPRASPSQQGSTPRASTLLPILHSDLRPGPSDGITHQTRWISHLSARHIQGNSQGPPSSKWQEITPLHKVLMRSHQEAFGQDTHLARKMREEYFRNHCPNFNNKNTCDLTDTFQC